VGIVLRFPRISAGASGFGSNESMCVSPPPIHRTMTDFAVPFPGAGLRSAAVSHDGTAAVAAPTAPMRRRSRRPRRGPKAGTGMAGFLTGYGKCTPNPLREEGAVSPRLLGAFSGGPDGSAANLQVPHHRLPQAVLEAHGGV